MKSAYTFILVVGLVLLTGVGAVLFVWAPEIVSLFRKDPEVITVGVAAIRYQALMMPILPLSVSGNMLFQSTGQARSATFLASCRQGIFFLPLAFVLPNIWGLTGVELIQPMADILSVLVSVPLVLSFFRRMDRVGGKSQSAEAE